MIEVRATAPPPDQYAVKVFMPGALEICAKCAAGTVVGKLLNVVFAALFADGAGAESPHRPRVIEGFPRYRWLLSVFGQAVAMQGCWALAFADARRAYDGLGTLAAARAWCLASADELAARGCRWEGLYLVVLFAAQARDMLPPPKTAPTTFIAHHAAVMTTAFLAFYLTGAFRRALRGRSGTKR